MAKVIGRVDDPALFFEAVNEHRQSLKVKDLRDGYVILKGSPEVLQSIPGVSSLKSYEPFEAKDIGFDGKIPQQDRLYSVTLAQPSAHHSFRRLLDESRIEVVTDDGEDYFIVRLLPDSHSDVLRSPLVKIIHPHAVRPAQPSLPSSS